MKSRFEMFEHQPTRQPVVVRAGWSWEAFLMAPLWAASHDLWAATAGMTALAAGIGYTLLTHHPARSILIAAWVLLSWWIAESGRRWVCRRMVDRIPVGELTYLGATIASSASGAMEEAKRAIEVRERFVSAAQRASPECLAQAASILERDSR